LIFPGPSPARGFEEICVVPIVTWRVAQLKPMQADVPYVGLLVSDHTAALSGKFTWADFDPWIGGTPYPLSIGPAA
jgi:hypothetical protein